MENLLIPLYYCVEHPVFSPRSVIIEVVKMAHLHADSSLSRFGEVKKKSDILTQTVSNFSPQYPALLNTIGHVHKKTPS